jgi:hypothetical protein
MKKEAKSMGWLQYCAIVALAAAIGACAPGGGPGPDSGKGSGDLTAISGRWCTGVQTGMTLGGTWVAEAAVFATIEYPFFEADTCVEPGESYWQITSGSWRGIILDCNGEYLIVSVQQVLYDNDGTLVWVTRDEYNNNVPESAMPELVAMKYTLSGSSLTVCSDQNQDRVYDDDPQVFETGASIDWSLDLEIVLAKQPATLTVTGTANLVGNPGPVPTDTLNLGVSVDPYDPDHTASYPVNASTSSVNFTIPGVKPGIYFVGASIDLAPIGTYGNSGDWLGSYDGNNPLNAPLTPVFSGLSTFDFDVEQIP